MLIQGVEVVALWALGFTRDVDVEFPMMKDNQGNGVEGSSNFNVLICPPPQNKVSWSNPDVWDTAAVVEQVP